MLRVSLVLLFACSHLLVNFVMFLDICSFCSARSFLVSNSPSVVVRAVPSLSRFLPRLPLPPSSPTILRASTRVLERHASVGSYVVAMASASSSSSSSDCVMRPISTAKIRHRLITLRNSHDGLSADLSVVDTRDRSAVLTDDNYRLVLARLNTHVVVDTYDLLIKANSRALLVDMSDTLFDRFTQLFRSYLLDPDCGVNGVCDLALAMIITGRYPIDLTLGSWFPRLYRFVLTVAPHAGSYLKSSSTNGDLIDTNAVFVQDVGQSSSDSPFGKFSYFKAMVRRCCRLHVNVMSDRH